MIDVRTSWSVPLSSSNHCWSHGIIHFPWLGEFYITKWCICSAKMMRKLLPLLPMNWGIGSSTTQCTHLLLCRFVFIAFVSLKLTVNHLCIDYSLYWKMCDPLYKAMKQEIKKYLSVITIAFGMALSNWCGMENSALNLFHSMWFSFRKCWQKTKCFF